MGWEKATIEIIFGVSGWSWAGEGKGCGGGVCADYGGGDGEGVVAVEGDLEDHGLGHGAGCYGGDEERGVHCSGWVDCGFLERGLR